MKIIFFLTVLSVACSHVCFAQKAPTFTAAEQAKVKQILGKDYVAVFNQRGELAITTPRTVSNVRALPGGGFRKTGSTVASNILIHKGWVLATSQEVLDAMRSKLGGERFAQLEKVMAYKK